MILRSLLIVSIPYSYRVSRPIQNAPQPFPRSWDSEGSSECKTKSKSESGNLCSRSLFKVSMEKNPRLRVSWFWFGFCFALRGLFRVLSSRERAAGMLEWYVEWVGSALTLRGIAQCNDTGYYMLSVSQSNLEFNDTSSHCAVQWYRLLHVECQPIKSSNLNPIGLFSTERGQRDVEN